LLVWGPLNGFGVVDPIESIVLGQRSAQNIFFCTYYPLEMSVGQGRKLFKWRAMGEGNGYKPWENALIFSSLQKPMGNFILHLEITL
jgi:hypothetical protein